MKTRELGIVTTGLRTAKVSPQIFTGRFWRKAAVRRMGGYGTTAPEYTCVSLRERTSAHFVRLRTPDLGLTFVLD